MKVIFLLQLLFPLAIHANEKLDFKPCLSALNEKSHWKKQIVPLNADGSNFVIKDNDKIWTIVLENIKYSVGHQSPGCNTYRGNTNLREVRVMYEMATESSSISQADKSEIATHCLPLIGREPASVTPSASKARK